MALDEWALNLEQSVFVYHSGTPHIACYHFTIYWFLGSLYEHMYIRWERNRIYLSPPEGHINEPHYIRPSWGHCWGSRIVGRTATTEKKKREKKKRKCVKTGDRSGMNLRRRDGPMPLRVPPPLIITSPCMQAACLTRLFLSLARGWLDYEVFIHVRFST